MIVTSHPAMPANVHCAKGPCTHRLAADPGGHAGVLAVKHGMLAPAPVAHVAVGACRTIKAEVTQVCVLRVGPVSKPPRIELEAHGLRRG